MKLSYLTAYIGTVSSHHKISDHHYILFLKDKNIASVKSLCISDFNEYTWSFVIIYNIIPVRK